MKTIVALSLLITSSVFAKTVTDEQSILTSQGIKVKVSNFCIAGDKIETKTEVEYCTETDKVWSEARRRSDRRPSYVCVATEIGKLSHPINYTKATCHREFIGRGDNKYLGPCTFTYAPAVLPTSYTFSTYKVTGRLTEYDLMTGEGLRKIKTVTVNIPACN